MLLLEGYILSLTCLFLQVKLEEITLNVVYSAVTLADNQESNKEN